jgi:hypothetical protein
MNTIVHTIRIPRRLLALFSLIAFLSGGAALTYASCVNMCLSGSFCCSIDGYGQHSETCCYNTLSSGKCCTDCLFFICDAHCTGLESWCNPFG